MLSEPDILQSFHLPSQRLVPHRVSLPTVSMSAGRLHDWNWHTAYVNTGDILTGSRNLRQYTGVISLLIRCNGGDGAVSQIGNLGDDRSAVARRATARPSPRYFIGQPVLTTLLILNSIAREMRYTAGLIVRWSLLELVPRTLWLLSPRGTPPIMKEWGSRQTLSKCFRTIQNTSC